MFGKELENIYKDVKKFKPRTEVLADGIKAKLVRANTYYTSELQETERYIMSRAYDKVIKALEKEDRKKARKAELEEKEDE